MKFRFDTAENDKIYVFVFPFFLRIYPLHLAQLSEEVAAKTAEAETTEERMENA